MTTESTTPPTDDGLLVLDASEIAAVYTPDVAIESQRVAFTELGHGRAQQPERLLMDGPGGSSTFCCAAKVAPDAPSVSKFGAVVPANSARGLPSISAVVLVLHPETGRPAALLDGTAVTTLRTAAASAAAVEQLAAAGADTLAVVGAGVQAEAHILLIAQVMELREVRVAAADHADAQALCERLGPRIDAPIHACDDAAQACEGAQVIACCTTTPDPVIADSDVAAGATVLSIGSFAPDRSELPESLMRRADLVVVDHAETAAAQAGSVVRAAASGHLDPASVIELGAVFAGAHPGRTSADQVIVYNSVGIGVQDAAAAAAILRAAEAAGLGRRVQL